MIFQGFDKKAIEFLEDLSKNNNKIWFEQNRHIWEKYIRKPSEDFVFDMGETLQILEPNIKFEPKVGKSLFKIYRDVRFSKDKTPMKNKIGILFWQGIDHRMQSSSFYIHFDKDEYFIASGIRNFKQPLLQTYRKYIQNLQNQEDLHHILKNLKTKGYDIAQPKFKRMPQGCDKDDKYSYLYLYGAMFASKTFKIDKTFHSTRLLDRCFKIYKDMHQLQQWVYKLCLG
jgi:uncharacterized protein (TIGR02453 family)